MWKATVISESYAASRLAWTAFGTARPLSPNTLACHRDDAIPRGTSELDVGSEQTARRWPDTDAGEKRQGFGRTGDCRGVSYMGRRAARGGRSAK